MNVPSTPLPSPPRVMVVGGGFGGLSFGGFFAWVLWSTVHVMYLVGFRNRLLVMVNWAWQWLIQARGARLITGNPRLRLTRKADL
jgi:NADH:ubiquinone reductase (H+-translocating)